MREGGGIGITRYQFVSSVFCTKWPFVVMLLFSVEMVLYDGRLVATIFNSSSNPSPLAPTKIFRSSVSSGSETSSPSTPSPSTSQPTAPPPPYRFVSNIVCHNRTYCVVEGMCLNRGGILFLHGPEHPAVSKQRLDGQLSFNIDYTPNRRTHFFGLEGNKAFERIYASHNVTWDESVSYVMDVTHHYWHFLEDTLQMFNYLTDLGDNVQVDNLYILNHTGSQHINANDPPIWHREALEIGGRGAAPLQPGFSPRPIRLISQNTEFPETENKMVCFRRVAFKVGWLCPQNFFEGDSLFRCTTGQVPSGNTHSVKDRKRYQMFRESCIRALPASMQKEIEEEAQPGRLNVALLRRIGTRKIRNWNEFEDQVHQAVTQKFGADSRWNISIKTHVPGETGVKTFHEHIRAFASAQIMITSHGAGNLATIFLNPKPRTLVIEGVLVCPVCPHTGTWVQPMGFDYVAVCPIEGSRPGKKCNEASDGFWNTDGVINTLIEYLVAHYFNNDDKSNKIT